jgi:hypothetical protein
MALKLTVTQPRPNAEYVIGKTATIGGTVQGKGMPEPVAVETVTVRLGNNPPVEAKVTPVKPPVPPPPGWIPSAVFTATIQVTVAAGPTNVTVRALFDSQETVTQLVPVNAVPFNPHPNVSGTYFTDQGSGLYYGVYYLQQIGFPGGVYWVGLSMDVGIDLDQVFHRGIDFTNVFNGGIRFDNGLAAWICTGEWVEMSRGETLRTGTLSFQIETGPDGNATGFKLISQSGGFGATHWAPVSFSDSPGMASRFSLVEKCSDPSNLADNGLVPYRDQTVFYGRVLDNHLNGGVGAEPPNVDDVYTSQAKYKNESTRSYRNFICDDSTDHDLKFNMAIDADPFGTTPFFDRNFETLGWGHLNPVNPQDVLHKLNDPTARAAGGFGPTESYLHCESVMYGHIHDCGQARNGDTGPVLYPGWADLGGNSILVNGWPIEGVADDANVQNTSGSLFFANQSRHTRELLIPGDFVRVTGALILDCGHSDWDEGNPPNFRTCYIGRSFSSENNSQNQEIHPIYSVDVIRLPLGPGAGQARQNLTGAWGADDGGTFYVRQIGSTVWILGLSRGREAPVPAGATPIPTYALVFLGALVDHPDGSATLSGGGVTVPYGSAAGGLICQTMVAVATNRKQLTTTACDGSFCGLMPSHFVKLYEPRDTAPPGSRFPDNVPAAITSSYTFTITAKDNPTSPVVSGVQNIWYRYYMVDTTPPPFQSQTGDAISFHLFGDDGVYAVECFATDNAGNDEHPARGMLVTLKNSAG